MVGSGVIVHVCSGVVSFRCGHSPEKVNFTIDIYIYIYI